MTADQFRAQERQRAEDHAPRCELTEAQFRRMLDQVPLLVLRQAARRWSAARGRGRPEVIAGIVAALHNPHTNQDDTYRVALGHIRACEIQIKRAN